jgi:hypothetical protein
MGAAPGAQVQKYQCWRNFLALPVQKYKYGRTWRNFLAVLVLADDEGKLHWKYTCVCVLYLLYVCMYVYVYVYVCMYVYVYKYTHTHTHIHILLYIVVRGHTSSKMRSESGPGRLSLLKRRVEDCAVQALVFLSCCYC